MPVSHSLRSRLIVLLIAMMCIIPFTLAWYLAKHPDLLEGRHKSNHGRLITPARPIDYAELIRSPISSAENMPEIKGRWVMVQVSGPVCNEACKATVEKTGRVRLMLNKELSRVRRLLLIPGQGDAASAREIAGLDPTLLVAGMSDDLLKQLQEAVGSPLNEGGVLLLDPFTNAMMWYEPGFDPYALVKDLQRLLRISQIG